MPQSSSTREIAHAEGAQPSAEATTFGRLGAWELVRRIGERLRIIPNHACVVSNLFDNVTLVSGDAVTGTLPVAARGRVD